MSALDGVMALSSTDDTWDAPGRNISYVETAPAVFWWCCREDGDGPAATGVRGGRSVLRALVESGVWEGCRWMMKGVGGLLLLLLLLLLTEVVDMWAGRGRNVLLLVVG
jgi:hypothetical protein